MIRDLELLLEDAIWLYFTGRAPLGPFTLANTVLACLTPCLQKETHIKLFAKNTAKVGELANKAKVSDLAQKADSADLYAQIQLLKAGELLTMAKRGQCKLPFLFKMWFHGANPDLILPDHLRLYQLSQLLYPNMILLSHKQKKRYGLEVLKISKEVPRIINQLIGKISSSINTKRQGTVH